VLRVGRKLFVGLSKRSNAEGIGQLAALLAPYDYEVVPVRVSGCLHLKSASPIWAATRCSQTAIGSMPLHFAIFDLIDVAAEEPHAANRLALDDTVIFPASFPARELASEIAGLPNREPGHLGTAKKPSWPHLLQPVV